MDLFRFGIRGALWDNACSVELQALAIRTAVRKVLQHQRRF